MFIAKTYIIIIIILAGVIYNIVAEFRFNAEVTWNTGVTEIDPTASTEKGDWVLAESAFYGLLSLRYHLGCHLSEVWTTCKKANEAIYLSNFYKEMGFKFIYLLIN